MRLMNEPCAGVRQSCPLLSHTTKTTTAVPTFPVPAAPTTTWKRLTRTYLNRPIISPYLVLPLCRIHLLRLRVFLYCLSSPTDPWSIKMNLSRVLLTVSTRMGEAIVDHSFTVDRYGFQRPIPWLVSSSSVMFFWNFFFCTKLFSSYWNEKTATMTAPLNTAKGPRDVADVSWATNPHHHPHLACKRDGGGFCLFFA